MAQTTTHGTIGLASDGQDLVDWISEIENADASQHSGTARPSYVTAGMLWSKIAADTAVSIFYFDGVADHYLLHRPAGDSEFFLIAGAAKVSTTPPSEAINGRCYFNASTGILYVYNGSSWVAINSPIDRFQTSVTREITGSTTILATDGGKELWVGKDVTGTVILTNVADTVDVGFRCAIWNRSTAATPATVTIRRSGSQLINDQTADITDCIPPHKVAYLVKIAANDWELAHHA